MISRSYCSGSVGSCRSFLQRLARYDPSPPLPPVTMANAIVVADGFSADDRLMKPKHFGQYEKADLVSATGAYTRLSKLDPVWQTDASSGRPLIRSVCTTSGTGAFAVV